MVPPIAGKKAGEDSFLNLISWGKASSAGVWGKRQGHFLRGVLTTREKYMRELTISGCPGGSSLPYFATSLPWGNSLRKRHLRRRQEGLSLLDYDSDGWEVGDGAPRVATWACF